ncbi:ABC transporter permease [Aestuariivivens insulae]|uniref:ABC transporter permease n=1 Tax=Aestuariivivens insulae TaxID=1621988 RepID=UPI001F5A2935|nr:ABC transporter permease [Aestuariivivens insulae]
MIRNYFKIAFRLFKKEKRTTLTNIMGMALGITCSILIYLWVQDELQYNDFVKNGDSVCYVMTNHPITGGDIKTWATTPQPLKAVLEEKYPVVDKVALLSWEPPTNFKIENGFLQQNGNYASPEIFDIFQFPFVRGGHEELYNKTKTIVVSERFASYYFGENWNAKNIIGEFITTDNEDSYEVVGVFKNLPVHSTLQFDFIIPFAEKLNKNPWLNHWGNFQNQMYVQLVDGISVEEANNRIKNAIIDNRPDEATTEELFLQPFSETYLYSNFEGGKVAGGRIEYVRILSVAAILILLLASINFMNLSTARAAKRSKETGVRKTLGALKANLRVQFLIESVLITGFGFIMAMGIVSVLLPEFNALTGKDIGLAFFTPKFIMMLVAFIVLLGLASGIYPAFYLSALKPTRSLTGGGVHNKNEAFFRKALMVFQFIITMVMIIGATSVYKQVSYIQNKNIGFDRENLVEVSMGDINPTGNYQAYRKELLEKPGILGVTPINQNILDIGNSTSDPEWDEKDFNEITSFTIMCTDPDFLSTTGIRLKEGRNFNRAMAIDTANFIINTAAQKVMQMKDPIGKRLGFWDREGKIIGVIENVHINSLHVPIEPFIIRYDLPMTSKLLVRVEANKTTQAIASLKALHDKFNPGKTFNYNFISDMYKGQYKSELLIKDMVFYFTIIAILISCLGLLSLVTYTTNQRAKEISIRKVLGASITTILRLLSKEFLVLIILSMVIAVPIAYYFIWGWLQNFAYRITLSWVLFVISGAVTIAIAIFIIGMQVLKAANANPIKSLKTE